MKAINTFTSGMNKDLDKSLLKSSHYLHSENFRMVTDVGASSGALENVKGNEFSIEIPDISDMYIGLVTLFKDVTDTFIITVSNGIDTFSEMYYLSTDFIVWFNDTFCTHTSQTYLEGIQCIDSNGTACIYCLGNYTLTINVHPTNGTHDFTNMYFTIIPSQTNLNIIGRDVIRESIILYTTACKSIDEDIINTTGYGQIWELTYRRSMSSQNIPTLTLKYNNLLGFSTWYLIKSKSRYETENIRKIYWCDERNLLRFANISGTTLLSLDPGLIDIIPDCVFNDPIIDSIGTGGNYYAGKLQYAYCLYNKNGQNTKFSNVTGLIHLTSSSDLLSSTGSNPSYYKGSELNEQTGKSVVVTINNIDDRYYGIKIVSILYTTINVDPLITYVYDGVIPSTGNISVVDDGHVDYGTLTVDEFNLLSSTFVIPKAIESKNDYLFIGNIKEKQFDIDFDARSYRFKKLSNNTYVPLDITDELSWGVDVKSDCINTQQDTYPLNTAYSYQQGSSILGGSGPAISYKFKLTEILADSNTNDRGLSSNRTVNPDKVINGITYKNPSYDNYASPYLDAILKGYQRGETYRFGIVFFDKKGAQSYVHWIADIKMPEMYDVDGKVTYTENGVDKYNFPICYWDSSSNETKFLILYPEFEIDFTYIPQEIRDTISSYSIVRVKREKQDRTILLQGLLQSTHINQSSFINEPLSGWDKTDEYFYAVDRNNTLVSILSPEINFFPEYFNFESGDRIEAISLFNYTTTIFDINGTESVFKYRSTAPLVNTSKGQLTRTLVDADVIGVSKNYQWNIGGSSYINYMAPGTGGQYGGTRLVARMNSAFSEPSYFTGDDFLLVNYKKNKIQYGGNTYNSRQNNEYIICSNISNIGLQNIYTFECFGGDTYISYFDYLQISYDGAEDPNSVQTISYIPVETSINCEMRHDTCYSREGNSFMLQETKAFGDTVFPGTYYSYLTDLYQYNSVYSQENTLYTYFPKSDFIDLEQKYDTMIRVSNKKTNGEMNDKWAVFNANDYKFVDSDYGALNDMLKYKDYLMFWQDHAMGVQSVLPKSTIADGNTAALRIGTGDILDRHDYYSTDSGCKHKFSVAASRDSLAWYDSTLGKIMYFKGSETPISDIKGMQSFFANNLNGNIKSYDNMLQTFSTISIYDDRFNEFLFTFTDGFRTIYPEKRYTLAFNDPLNAFTSFYSFIPAWYIRTRDRLLTVPIDAPNKIYIQNIGNYGEFYDTYYDSSIKFIVNENYSYQKVYDSLQFLTEVTLNGVDLLKETINKIRCYNSYQNSDWYNTVYYSGVTTPVLSSDDILTTRRETSWSLSLPRNATLLSVALNHDIFDPANLDQTRPFRERLRDNSLTVDMVYENSALKNYRFLMPYTETTYRLSER